MKLPTLPRRAEAASSPVAGARGPRTGGKLARPALIVAGLIAAAVVVTIPDDQAVETSGGALPAAQVIDAQHLALPRLNGGRWALDDERGRVVVLNFWAYWCLPCREETPALVAVSDAYRGRGVDVVGVSMDNDDPRAVRNFVRETALSYPVLVAGPRAPITGDIDEYPTTLVIDRSGAVVVRYVGALGEAQLRRALDRMLR